MGEKAGKEEEQEEKERDVALPDEGHSRRGDEAEKKPTGFCKHSRRSSERKRVTYAHVTGARERKGEADERRAPRDTFVAGLIEKPLSLFHRDNGSRNGYYKRPRSANWLLPPLLSDFDVGIG